MSDISSGTYSVDQVNEIIESLAVLAWSSGMSRRQFSVDPKAFGSLIAGKIRNRKLAAVFPLTSTPVNQ